MRFGLTVVFAATAALVLAGCGSAGSTHASAKKPHPAAASSTAASTPTIPPKTHAQKVADKITAWSSGPGYTDLQAVAKALGVAGAAERAGNVSASGAACVKLGNAVQAALAAPQIPGPPRRWYAMALAQLEVSATDCQNGISSNDPSLVAEGTTHLNKGTAYLAKAVKEINKLANALP